MSKRKELDKPDYVSFHEWQRGWNDFERILGETCAVACTFVLRVNQPPPYAPCDGKFDALVANVTLSMLTKLSPFSVLHGPEKGKCGPFSNVCAKRIRDSLTTACDCSRQLDIRHGFHHDAKAEWPPLKAGLVPSQPPHPP